MPHPCSTRISIPEISTNPNFYNSNFSWTVSLLSNWNIPNVAMVQLMADYRGPILLPQGEVDPIYGIDIGIRREILNNKGTISLNVSDIFNTRVFRVQTEDAAFSQMRFFNKETRIGTLSFTYRFGGFHSKDPDGKSSGYGDDPF